MGDISWLDARVAPETAIPPLDFLLEVTGQFNHPAAAECRRSVDRAGLPPRSGVPDDPAGASEAWCRGQFVVMAWRVVEGPEGRPLVPGEVQLHRAEPAEGCAPVGLGVLTFRMDPTETDPIWLESGPPEHRVIPFFGPGFATAVLPEVGLVVVDRSGAVAAHDGLTIEAESSSYRGYGICPMWDWITIHQP